MRTYRFRDKEPTVKFEQSPSSETVAKYEDDESIKNGWRVYDNEIIVLKEIGDVGMMHEYHPSLDAFLDSTGTVVLLSPLAKSEHEKSPWGKASGEIKRQESVSGASVSEPCLYLDFVPTKEPLPPILAGTREITPPNRYLDLAIRDNDGSGGFFVVDDQAITTQAEGRTQEVIFLMKEAPSEGYSPRLRIDNETLTSGQHGFDPIYFYVRMNGLYGKGYVQSASYLRGKATVYVTLCIQHDGSRNTRTK